MPESIQENKLEDKKLKTSPNNEKELLNYILDTWEISNNSRIQWKLDKEEGLKLYYGIKAKKDFPFENCANLHVPLVRTIADTLHSNIMGSIAEAKPVSTIPVGPEDAAKSRKIEKLLNWQFTTQVDYTDMVDKIVQSCLVYDHAAVKIRYVVEHDKNKKLYDGLKVDVLPVERFLFPPDALDDDVEKFDYCIQEIPLTKSDLKKRMNGGMYNKINLEDIPNSGLSQTQIGKETKSLLENIREIQSGLISDVISSKRGYLTVLEWYGNYDLDGDGIDELLMVSVLLETKQVLRVVNWNFPKPFVMIRAIPILDKPVGESVADLLGRINNELNTIHNQRVDAVTFQNIPFFFFDPMSGFNPNNLHLVPGLGIPTNGPPSQAVYFPTLNMSRPEMYKEEELLFLMAERQLGAGANTQGILNPKRISATEINIIDRRAGIRFLTIFNRIKKGLKKLFNLALILDKEKLPPETQVRITGIGAATHLFDTLKREDIQANVDIIINGNSIVDEQAEKQEQMQVYQIGLLNPLVQRDTNALYELTRDTFSKLGVQRVDAYLRRPEDSIPKSPDEEHNLFLQEEEVRPVISENVQYHLEQHAAFINSENFKLLSRKGQLLAIRHYSETERMRVILEQLEKINQINQINSMMLKTAVTGEMPEEVTGRPPQNEPRTNRIPTK